MSTDRNLANTSARRRRRILVADHCDRCKLGQQVDVTRPPDRGSDTICRCTCHRVCRVCNCTDFHACLGGCSPHRTRFRGSHRVAMIDRLWRKLADHYLPAEELRRIGRVHFVPVEYDQWRSQGAIIASGGICTPYPPTDPRDPRDWLTGLPVEWPGFRRWPNLLEAMPRFRTPRGGIRFILPPGATLRGRTT